jgi:TetR/AcrR family transcriptional repressor of nem operon
MLITDQIVCDKHMARDGTKTRERILDSAERLILHQGLSATTVDAVLADAETSKGAFFHHFPSKHALARALIERYAAGDIEYLEENLAKAEAETDDPARQVIAFIRLFEEAADELVAQQPSCLYVSYIYEKQLFDDGTNDVIVDAIVAWRERIAGKLRAAAQLHPLASHVDLDDVADHLFVTFEGAFVLTRATGDASLMRRQLALARQYVAVLFGVAAD